MARLYRDVGGRYRKEKPETHQTKSEDFVRLVLLSKSSKSNDRQSIEPKQQRICTHKRGFDIEESPERDIIGQAFCLSKLAREKAVKSLEQSGNGKNRVKKDKKMEMSKLINNKCHCNARVNKSEEKIEKWQGGFPRIESRVRIGEFQRNRDPG